MDTVIKNNSQKHLLEKLNELSRMEMRKFRDFANSPYFNKYQTVRILANHLYSLHPMIQESDISIETVSLIVYGKAIINVFNIKRLLSETSLLYENFILQRKSEKDVHQRSILLLNSLNSEGLDKLFNKQIRNVNKIESKIILKDKYFYINKHEFHRTLMLHNLNFNHLSDEENLKSLVQNLDYHFIITKLWSFLNLKFIDHEYMTAHKLQISFYDEILSYIDKNEKIIAADHIYIYTYYLALKMFVTNEDKYLYLLMIYFKKNKNKFTGLLLTDYYGYLINYLRTRLNEEIEDRKKLNEILFKTYERIFTDHKTAEVIYDAGKLEDSVYLNAVGTAVYNRKYKWAEHFIDRYRNKLHPNYRNDAWYLANAVYHDALKDYKTSLLYLNKIAYSDESYRNFVKLFKMEIHFKKGETELLEFKLDNLLRTVKRQGSHVKVFRSSYTLYVKYFRKLIRLKTSYNTSGSDVKLFIKELKNEKTFVTRRFWMVDMAGELLKK
jgi:hypothetical protein